MRVSTGSILIAAAIVAGLPFAAPAGAAERDHGSASSPSSSPGSFFKKSSGSGDSFWSRRRSNGGDSGWFFSGQRQRDLDPTPDVVEQAEQPLVYAPEKLE